MNEPEQWWIGALAQDGSAHDADTLGTRVIDLGPQHPTRAGLVGLRLWWDGDIVQAAEIQPGYLHRAAEKLFEVRDYRQVLMLADRHDWQASFSGELVAAMACEQAMGLTAPPRAVWLRTLLAEVARVGSHLAFLSWAGHSLRDAELSASIRRSRDDQRNLLLRLSGNRLHPMLSRLGGLAADVDDEWLSELDAWSGRVAGIDLAGAVARLELPDGLGHIDQNSINSHGISGPAARASGARADLRRAPGYLAYSELEWPAPRTIDSGDAKGRFAQLAVEIGESLALISQCAARLASVSGPVDVKLSKIIKLPDSETWLSIEAPLGVAGIHVVSRGGTTPWRFALRTPTFATVNALQSALVGTPREHLDAVIASLGWTIGDLDK